MWTRTTIGVVLALVVSLVLIEAQNGKGKGNANGNGNGKGNAKGTGNGKGKGKYSYDSREHDDHLYICLKEGKKSRRCPDDKNVSPEFYDFNVFVNGRAVHLHLNRNDKLRTNVPTRTLSGGGYIEKKIQDSEESVFYQDTSNGAAFVVEADGTGAKSLFGVFHVEGDRYILQTPGRNKTLAFGSNTTRFEIIKENTVDVAYDQSNLADTVPYKRPYYRHPRRKRATGSYQIELLMVVDYSIYQFWYDKSTKTTVIERETDALQKVRQFYAFVINGMDAMYKNIQTSSYTISILFAGIIIAQTSADSPWTETIVVKTATPNQVDAGIGLTNFRTWILAQSSLPGHDHAMLFTRYDLTNLGSTATAGGDINSLVEDKEIASRAVAFVVNSTRKGIVPLCTDVANLLRAKRSLEKKVLLLKRENEALRSGSRPTSHSTSPTPASVSSDRSILHDGAYHTHEAYRPPSRCSQCSSTISDSPNIRQRPSSQQKSPVTSHHAGQNSSPISQRSNQEEVHGLTEVLVHKNSKTGPLTGVEDQTVDKNGLMTKADVHIESKSNHVGAPQIDRRRQCMEKRNERQQRLSKRSTKYDITEDSICDELLNLESSFDAEKDLKFISECLQQIEVKQCLDKLFIENELHMSSDQKSKDQKGLQQNNTYNSKQKSQSTSKKWSRALSPSITSVCSETIRGCRCSRCESAMLNGDEVNDAQKFSVSYKLQVQHGDYVVAKGDKSGRICYIGHIDNTPDILYVGLELAQPVGQHDGFYKRKRYFTCKKDHGILIPLQEILCKLNIKTPKWTKTHKTENKKEEVTEL